MKIWEILKPENIGKIYISDKFIDRLKVVERYPYDGTSVSLDTMGYEEHIEDITHLYFILTMNFEEVG